MVFEFPLIAERLNTYRTGPSVYKLLFIPIDFEFRFNELASD